jgi:alanine racemase
MSDKSFNCIRIDTKALQANFSIIRKIAGDRVPVMAMVKADAYGHGMVMAAGAFARAGCTVFGVAELREAVLLRQAGIGGDIFVTLGFAAEDTELLFRYALTPVIYSLEAARVLSGTATALGREIGIHIKVDSGMSRLGIPAADLSAFLEAVLTLPGLRVAGIMSHFPESDNP